MHRHTHVWKFIDGLKQDSSLSHLLMAQMIAGAPKLPQQRIYREVSEHIQRWCMVTKIMTSLAF